MRADEKPLPPCRYCQLAVEWNPTEGWFHRSTGQIMCPGDKSTRAAPMGLPSITCPKCGMTSYNPTDVETGYCGNCHGYTSPVDPLQIAKRVVKAAEEQQPKGDANG